MKYFLRFFYDHDSVYFQYFPAALAHVSTYGPGIWRLNFYLFHDENFCDKIKILIRAHNLFRNAFPSLHDWWDFLKESTKFAAINAPVNI